MRKLNFPAKFCHGSIPFLSQTARKASCDSLKSTLNSFGFSQPPTKAENFSAKNISVFESYSIWALYPSTDMTFIALFPVAGVGDFV